jgi:hypothetical protein
LGGPNRGNSRLASNPASDPYRKNLLALTARSYTFAVRFRADRIESMSAFKCVSTASLMAALALIVSSQAASASVKITVSFDYVEMEVSPFQAEHRSHFVNTYQISTSKRIDFSSNLNPSGQGALGRTMTLLDSAGRSWEAVYRIDRGAIVITGSGADWTTVTRIVTDGHSSCSATRNYVKKPGHQYFEEIRTTNHERMLDSSIRAENVS